LTVSLIRDSAGQPLYTLAVTEDIEQRKKAEDDIRRALQRERELSELKSQFITTVSHEFRTPLTTIISSAELLERKNLELNDPKRAKYFNNIQRGANRITHVLDDILMLMKLESETITSDSTSLNLSQFCRDIVAKWQKSAGEQYCISFVDNSTVDLIANLDASLLHQVLSHLVFNAIRYSPKGGSICIEMICKSRSVIFYVRDQGIGIPVAEQTKIFDTFYRANNADSIPGTPGAGLGLAIAAKAVALQNGTIEVNSEIGRGTTFIVSLPLS
jgi:signal transduction histidine kinase